MNSKALAGDSQAMSISISLLNIDRLNKPSWKLSDFEGIVGRGQSLWHVLHLVETVASRYSTVLLLGESDIGKELVAKAIHKNSCSYCCSAEAELRREWLCHEGSTEMPELSFTVNSDATASIHDEGIVLLHVRTGCLYTSNRIGSCIWRGIGRQMALEEIAKEISDEYRIALSKAEEHTVRFVADLERHALIQREVAP